MDYNKQNLKQEKRKKNKKKKNNHLLLLMVLTAFLAIIGIVSVVLWENRAQLLPDEKEPEIVSSDASGDIVMEEDSQSSRDETVYSTKEFLKHEDFFLPEDDNSTGSAGNELTLIAVSVEQGLRVRVVNEAQETVTGEAFVLCVGEDTEYRDIDRDGVIFVAGLKAGEYKIGLKEIEGYQVPADQMWVHVKDKVEYFALEDISYLVKTEEDLVKAEDLENRNLTDDADETESMDRLPAERASFGIDVSKWNREIDWNLVKQDGVEYAIIRCGYRGYTTGSLVEDPYFISNIEGAKAAGLKVGIYFFSQAVTEVEAVEEASTALMLADGYELDYPIFIDTESVSGMGRADHLEPSVRTDICNAFCKTIQNSGRDAGVYACRNWLYNHLDAAELSDYFIWLAEYRSEPLYLGNYDMWQYSSKGQVSGIEGNVDLNLSYRER